MLVNLFLFGDKSVVRTTPPVKSYLYVIYSFQLITSEVAGHR